ncbi:hypothetical protein [Capillimicrobium parvum]|uniref:Uncharacterized protein n=1 Tax=Capillimicrobium parvum TaxID=2884022 RepID=A0A9E6Y5C7_9ACTN|nr:hypothetical protein [Capillimicrobium parvum]UGS39038.1 hypothetical protein DSM104329_05470 [Capillimicrobium parvum]
MAKSRQSDLVDTLRARGLRKRVATTVADAVEGGRKRAKDPQKTVREVLADLKRASQEIEDRAAGGPAKRKDAARKAAATRQRNAAKRSAAAKKAARTRKANAQG